MKPTLLQIDTLDDRREIWHLLHRLPPDARLAFMDWACSLVVAPGNTRPVMSRLRMAATIAAAWRDNDADEQLTNLLYGDLLVLGSQWGVDLVRCTLALEQWVKRPQDRRAFAACTSAAAASRTPGSSGSAHRPDSRSARSA